jgi:hypothetical protein
VHLFGYRRARLTARALLFGFDGLFIELAQAQRVALIGSVYALLHWWRAHRRSMLAFSRPGAACGPPGADLSTWPAALRARA